MGPAALQAAAQWGCSLWTRSSQPGLPHIGFSAIENLISHGSYPRPPSTMMEMSDARYPHLGFGGSASGSISGFGAGSALLCDPDSFLTKKFHTSLPNAAKNR